MLIQKNISSFNAHITSKYYLSPTATCVCACACDTATDDDQKQTNGSLEADDNSL